MESALIVVAAVDIPVTADERLFDPRKLSGHTVLDPLIAITLALNIVGTGWRLLRETTAGLLVRALPPEAEARGPGASCRCIGWCPGPGA